jgi:diguanylate cyclase (GGDEF)-like protein
MFQPRSVPRRQAVRDVLRDTATLINSSGPLETILAAVCENLLKAADAQEVTLAIGGARGCTVRWRRTRQGFSACEEVVDDAIARAVLSDGQPRLDLNRAYAPLRDDGRVSGAVWMTSKRDVYDEDGLALVDAFAGYLSLALQKAALRERARHLEELTVIDALTGVPNRRAFDAALEREWTRAIRAKRPIAVALLDIDSFKLYNDAYGHPQGDACLQQIARACKASVVRATDCFARYGGEEFCVVIPDAESRCASKIAERLREAVSLLAIPHEGVERGIVTVSVGVASMLPKRGQHSSELVEASDRALYRAKGTGRDRVVVVDPTEAEANQRMPSPLPVPNNLPVASAQLIGRNEDLARIEDLLGQYRVVTLLGAGGVGKTRLSLDAARRQLNRYPDGVWLVELAPLGDEAHVVSAFSSLFGVEEHADRSSLASLVAALRERHTLLVVDNCEHLVANAARTIAAIIRDCPRVRVLATSREPLTIPGEATYRVPPHTIPLPNAGLRAADAVTYSAVALFAERASAADDSFILTDGNAPLITEICRRLDGIALAIELAAARVRVLDVAQIAALLDSRFRLLSANDRSALPHQQTLRATIDWSYDLLGVSERLLFGRLAIFIGGFTLQAILDVAADDELEADAVFGALSALVDKSLVVFEAPRYRLLESTREYAIEKLDASNERDALAVRHASYYRAQVDRASLAEGQGSYRAWIAPLIDDLDNLRAALEWTLGSGHEPLIGVEICAALVETSSLGRWSEWAKWNTAARDALAPGQHPFLRGRVLTRRAELAARYGAFGGTTAELAAAEEAYTLLHDAPEPKWRLEALNAYATALLHSELLERASAIAREGLELARDTHDFVYQASFLRRLASFLIDTEPHEAEIMYEESISLCRVLENDFGLALSHHGMSHLYFRLGRVDEAIAAARIAADVRRDISDRRGLVNVLTDITQFSLVLGRTDGVGDALREALEIVRRTENTLGLALVIQASAAFAFAGNAPETAARLTGFADAAFASLGFGRETVAKSLRETLLANLRGALAAERLGDLLAAGGRLDSIAAAELAARLAISGEPRRQPV